MLNRRQICHREHRGHREKEDAEESFLCSVRFVSLWQSFIYVISPGFTGTSASSSSLLETLAAMTNVSPPP